MNKKLFVNIIPEQEITFSQNTILLLLFSYVEGVFN